ncbi:MAG: DUF2905 domain-containing protein [Synergistaceae bacterium]|nr:DUF2905 domain-containing protein [Synergistaceae bacterium]
MARTLMTIGAILFLAGAAVWAVSKLGLPLGRLPGDITWETKNVKIHFPLVTMLVVSGILTVILNIIARIGRK